MEGPGFKAWGLPCRVVGIVRDPKKHISISILWGYPYLNGLHYKGVYMGYTYPKFSYVLFWCPI